MGRKQMAPGAHGDIEVKPQYRDESGTWRTYGRGDEPRKGEQVARWRARAAYRGWDGEKGEVSRLLDGGRRRAEVMAEAEREVGRALDVALRQGQGTGSADEPLIEAGRSWLADIARTDSGKSASTVSQYASAFTRHIEPKGSGVSGLTLAQVNNPPTLRKFLQRVADEHGTGSAKMARNVLAGILGQAVSDGALNVNALREVRPVAANGGQSRQRRRSREERDTRRDFTEDELARVLAFADGEAEGRWERVAAKDRAVADIMHFMAGTGVRVGEALTLRWEHVDLDGRCARIEGTKSKAARRVVGLSVDLRDRLAERKARGNGLGLVFPAPATGESETEWDRSNASRALARVLREAGCGWATPHTFRRSLITRLHEAGAPLHLIADAAGHSNPAMTASVYLGRGSNEADVIALADRL